MMAEARDDLGNRIKHIAGELGARLAKRKLLAAIYLGRAVAIAVFLLAPISPLSVYLFASVMGFLWLSTVPLTSGIVAQIFGVAHLSTEGRDLHALYSAADSALYTAKRGGRNQIAATADDRHGEREPEPTAA